MSPEEGFLLSRIDGNTTWRVLREIGGVPPEQVDRCIEQWLKDGLVLLDAAKDGRSRSRAAASLPRGEVDTSLELDVEVQKKALDFESRLDASYHEILGVARSADEREIKRAYFELSKLFHPDRYFGREIGHFAQRLDRIFKKVALSYELLMDPTTRAEIERATPPPPEPEPAPTAAAPQPGTPQKLTKRQMLERLRRQFKIPDKILAERRFKARQFHEAARVAQYQHKWNDAASCIRLAIAFDPWNDAYKEDFAGIQAEVNQLRAAELLEEASGAWDAKGRSNALKLYEEAMGYRPSDPEIHARAALVACELEDWERGREYAERACELAPDQVEHHLVLARALRGQGLRSKAKKVLEEAGRIDPHNETVKDELRRLRRVQGRASGGKT